ncbi:hypothetical protein LC607_35785 [Nostoc sp. CHAB 5824]|nr:hypothetical protein [Nostoc sp. CHAB 5824]
MKFGKLLLALSMVASLALAPVLQSEVQAQTKRSAAWYKRNGYAKTKTGTWYKKRDAAWYKRNGYTRTTAGTWRKRDAAWYQRNGYAKTKTGTWYKKK